MSKPTTTPRRNRRAKKVSCSDTPEATPLTGILCEEAAAFRSRVGAVGSIVRDTFGVDQRTNPALAARDAYLVVVARIVEALVFGGEDLSTSDLVSLSKALAEHRRLDLAKSADASQAGSSVSPSDTPDDAPPNSLPDSFGRVVDQIYGTNLLAERNASPDSTPPDRA